MRHDPVEEWMPQRLCQRYSLRGVVHQHLEDEVEQLAVVVAVGHSVFLTRYRMRACTVGEIFYVLNPFTLPVHILVLLLFC